MAFEAVGVSALFLAHLAVELELLKALGLRTIGDILRGSCGGGWGEGGG